MLRISPQAKATGSSCNSPRPTFWPSWLSLDSDCVLAHLSAPSFDATTFEVWGALLCGPRCIIIRDAVTNTMALGQTLKQHGVTTAWLTTALFNAMIDESSDSLAGLKQLLIGGEALSVSHVFDQQCKPVPIGIPGELFIGGDGLARGYLGSPELTEQRFAWHDVAGQRERLFRTGDNVRWRLDGNLEFLGRFGNQVKIRGFRIEPSEVGVVLAKHAGVATAVVAVREETPGEKRLVAYVVAREGCAPTENSMRQYLKDRLPSYLVPTNFVVVPRIPVTPHGKTDFRQLPAPQSSRSQAESASLAAPTELEEKLAKIWTELLDRNELGVRDDFFELGGHSILAARMFARIESDFHVRMPLNLLYRDPTISALARLIETNAEVESVSQVIEIQAGGQAADQAGESKPALYFLHGLGGDTYYCHRIVEYLAAGQPVYGINLSIEEQFEQFDSIEQMASAHLEAITRFQPQGPYRLAGYSFGGVLAYELARQLEQHGHLVDRVIMARPL